MANDLECVRRAFADRICTTAGVGDARIADAFAKVPREDFLGPGPWRVIGDGTGWRTTADPRDVYEDALVVLDETQGVNNGQPSLYAVLFQLLNPRTGEHVAHMGAGTGYYSALLAELVGSSGSVIAVEIDPLLAERARAALRPWPQAKVVAGDALKTPPPAVDVILASAGLSFPPLKWVRALQPGGRLVFPLTTQDQFGCMLLIAREGTDPEKFSARLSMSVRFIDCVGDGDPRSGAAVAEALAGGGAEQVSALRLDPHARDANCWLHARDWCLSTRASGNPRHA